MLKWPVFFLKNCFSQEQILKGVRGCLYESRDGTKNGTGRLPGSRFYHSFLSFCVLRLYGAGTFFIPSRLTGIPFRASGIPAKRDTFSPCKRSVPLNRDDKILILWKVLYSYNRMNTYVCLVNSLTTMLFTFYLFVFMSCQTLFLHFFYEKIKP